MYKHCESRKVSQNKDSFPSPTKKLKQNTNISTISEASCIIHFPYTCYKDNNISKNKEKI